MPDPDPLSSDPEASLAPSGLHGSDSTAPVRARGVDGPLPGPPGMGGGGAAGRSTWNGRYATSSPSRLFRSAILTSRATRRPVDIGSSQMKAE